MCGVTTLPSFGFFVPNQNRLNFIEVHSTSLNFNYPPPHLNRNPGRICTHSESFHPFAKGAFFPQINENRVTFGAETSSVGVCDRVWAVAVHYCVAVCAAVRGFLYHYSAEFQYCWKGSSTTSWPSHRVKRHNMSLRMWPLVTLRRPSPLHSARLHATPPQRRRQAAAGFGAARTAVASIRASVGCRCRCLG